MGKREDLFTTVVTIAIFVIFIINFISFVSANTFIDKNSADFNNGTYNNTTYNDAGVILLGTNLSGTFTSRIFDSVSISNWNNLNITRNISYIDYFFALDDNADVWKSINGINWTLIKDDYNNGDANGAKSGFFNSSESYFVVFQQRVYFSSNFGINWTKINNDYNGAEGQDADVAIADKKDYIYIIEGDQDVWKSEDSGISWTKTISNLNAGSGVIAGLVVNSSNTLISVDVGSEIWSSTNGINWTQINSDYNGGEGNGASAMAIDSNNVLYILKGQQVWRSVDSGISWTKTSDDFDISDGHNGISITTNSDNYVYIIDGNEDVYKSIDLGVSWIKLTTNLNAGNGNARVFSAISRRTNITFQTRNCSLSDCSDGIFTNNNLNNLNKTSRYFQYKAIFSTPDSSINPKLYNISIDYTILDNSPPSFSDYLETPINNSQYINNQQYQFNISINDNTAINSVWIEFNNINYTTITNNSNIYTFLINNLAVGTYYYKWYANDSYGNLNNSEIRYYTINKGTNTLNLLSSVGWSPITYSTESTFSCSSLYSNPSLYIDNTGVSNPVTIVLSAGSHNIKCNISETANYSSEMSQGTLVVNKASTNTNITTTPNSPIIYGNLSNFSCSNSQNQETVLYINGIDKTTEISLEVLRAAGTYTLNCSSIENQNYSASSYQTEYIINKTNGDIKLYLNSNEDNLTIDYPEQYNITSTTSYGTVLIYKDNVDITADNGNFLIPSRNSAYYNITAVSSGDENHSLFSITRWLNVTLDLTSPTLDLISPQEGASYGYNKNLLLNYTVSDPHLDSCWYNINNQDNITLTNCQNTLFSVTGDGTYTVYLYSNDTLGNIAIKNSSFTILLGAPTITLTSPIGVYLNDRNVTFRYVPTDLDLRACELWGNFTGVFSLNQTTNQAISGIENTFNLTLDDGIYEWNIKCNDSLGNNAFNGNKTFTIDTTSPVLTITSPIGKQTTRNNIPLIFNIVEPNKNNCFYNVYRGTNLEIANTSISCNGGSFNLTLDADFTLNLFANDLAGNSNSASSSFNVDTSTPVINPPNGGSSGGGGGGSSVFINSTITTQLNLEITPIETIMYPGEENQLELIVKNKAAKSVNKCRIVPKKEQEELISTTDIKNIAPGEIVEFPFKLILSEELNPELFLSCLEGNKSIPIKVVFVKSNINIKIYEITLDENNQIRIKYSVESDFDSSTELIFSVYSDEQKIKEQKQNLDLIKEQKVNRELLLELDNVKPGLLKISVTKSDEQKPIAEESILYGPKITGFALSDLITNTSSVYIIVIILVSLVIAGIIIRRIIIHRRANIYF